MPFFKQKFKSLTISSVTEAVKKQALNTLRMDMQNGIAPIEGNLAISRKISYACALWTIYSACKHLSQRNPGKSMKGGMHKTIINWNTFYISKVLEATQMPINRELVKQLWSLLVLKYIIDYHAALVRNEKYFYGLPWNDLQNILINENRIAECYVLSQYTISMSMAVKPIRWKTDEKLHEWIRLIIPEPNYQS